MFINSVSTTYIKRKSKRKLPFNCLPVSTTTRFVSEINIYIKQNHCKYNEQISTNFFMLITFQFCCKVSNHLFYYKIQFVNTNSFGR